MGLPRHDRHDGSESCGCSGGVIVGNVFNTGGRRGGEVVGFVAEFLVGEVGKGGVQEEGEDVGEHGGVDQVGGFVEEAAEGGGGCGCWRR